MSSKQTRRDFLNSTLAGGAGLGLSTSKGLLTLGKTSLAEESTGLSEPPSHPGVTSQGGPAWMRHGIVAASMMESLSFVLRRGGEPANVVEEWHADRSEEAIRNLKTAGVNLVVINFHKGAGLKAEAEDIEVTRKFTELAHRYGLKVVGYVGGTLLYERFFREHPEARDWMQVNEFGHPIYYNSEQTFRYAACRNTPGYQAFIKEVMRVGIQELKLDGIHFDQMMWWPEPHSCREPHCRDQFRSYLRQRYADPGRAQLRFGWPNVDNLVPPPYDLEGPPVTLSELHNPLMQEWARFRAASLAERCGEFSSAIQELNPQATMIYNPPILSLATNIGFIYGVDCQQLFAHGHGVWSEEDSLPEWTSDGRLVSRIRSYKAARAMGQTVFVWQRYTGDNVYTTGPIVLRLAESLAYNDANLGVLAGGDAQGNEVPPVVDKYIRFFNSHRDDLLHTTTIADAAVLRSFSSIEFNPAQSNFSTVLFEQTLIQCKVPFGIIFDRHLEDLGRYKVLVLANQDALSDDQTACIRDFVKNGGGLVATESTSLLTDWRLQRSQFGLADVFGIASPPARSSSNTPIRREFGKGRVVYIPHIESATPPPRAEMNCTISTELWKLPKNYVDLIESVKWAAGNALSASVDAPLWVTAELAEQKSSNTWLLHLLNFRFQEPVEDISVEIRVPGGLQLREVVMETPDAETGRPLSVSVHESLASFRVPLLRVYSLIFLRMAKR